VLWNRPLSTPCRG